MIMNRKLQLIIVCGILLCIAALGLTELVARTDANAVKEYLAEAKKLAEEYKFDESLKLLDKALAIEPKNEQVLLLQLGVFIESNRADDALKANDKLIALFPNNSDYLVGKMFLAGKMRRYEEALKLWDKFQPDDAPNWMNREDCLVALNRNDEALKALEKALEFEPE